MKIIFDYNKSIEENASKYYDISKKNKEKIMGAKETINKAKKKLIKLSKKEKKETIPRKKDWFEKFRWFKTSEGFLVIGGRDATSNEIIVKKHSENNDLIFHTDMAGSPFVVLKTNSKKPSKKSLQEVADFTASYSKAWSKGYSSLEVFYVNPDQVSKKANTGEYVKKGSFMIHGKTNYLTGRVELAIGNYEETTMAGPESSIKKYCKTYKRIIPGSNKTTNIAKKIKHFINCELDEIVRVIPSGGSIIVRNT